MIDILRTFSMTVWLIVAVYGLGSFVRIYRGSARYYDQLSALISVTGMLFAAFSLRWYLPPSDTLFASLYAFSAILAFSFFITLRRYQGAIK